MLRSRPALSALLFAAPLALLAAAPARTQDKPAPDLPVVRYGPHPRNVADLWKAKRAQPTPLVVFIHGGGFRNGDKERLPAPLLHGLLDAGISVLAINYRLSPEVAFPAHYMDGARAIQFARSRAAEWNVDLRRVGAAGSSAGAGTALWLGFHDELADPTSTDPVLRESTRLTCMAVANAQSTYDPRVIRTVIGGRTHEHPVLRELHGLQPAEVDTPKAHALYEASAPITHLSAGDPPVYTYHAGSNAPLPADALPGLGIHHPNFGSYLKEKMDRLGIECLFRRAADGEHPYRGPVAFFVRHLRPAPPASSATSGAFPRPTQRLPRTAAPLVAGAPPALPSP